MQKSHGRFNYLFFLRSKDTYDRILLSKGIVPSMAVVKILVAIGTITIVFLAYLFDKIFNHPPAVPNLEDDFWWGPGEVKKVDESIRPFRIQVSKEVINLTKIQ